MPILAASLPFLGEVVVLFALSAIVVCLCVQVRLEADDRLLVQGTADAFIDAGDLFRPSGTGEVWAQPPPIRLRPRQ